VFEKPLHPDGNRLGQLLSVVDGDDDHVGHRGFQRSQLPHGGKSQHVNIPPLMHQASLFFLEILFEHPQDFVGSLGRDIIIDTKSSR